jgi:hypothetical protein
MSAKPAQHMPAAVNDEREALRRFARDAGIELTPEQLDRWEETGDQPWPDQPEVAALRKWIRHEALTAEEEALLAKVHHKPDGQTIAQDQVMAMLAERKLRGV